MSSCIRIWVKNASKATFFCRASGSATFPVHPRRRNSPSIRAALARAQLVADPLALRSAERRAAGVARAADMRPGALFALAEEPRQPFAADILTNEHLRTAVGKVILDPLES